MHKTMGKTYCICKCIGINKENAQDPWVLNFFIDLREEDALISHIWQKKWKW